MPEIQALLESLRRTPTILTQFVHTIPESQLTRRRGEGFWTVAEHLSHLAQVQPMLLGRFQRFGTEEHPTFVPFLPSQSEEEAEPAPPLATAVALVQFTLYREQQLLLLENAEPSLWEKRGTHPEYDEYSLSILTRHVLMHDYWHMYRMEELWLTKDAYLTKLV